MQIYYLQPPLIIFTKGANNYDQHCILWDYLRIFLSWTNKGTAFLYNFIGNTTIRFTLLRLVDVLTMSNTLVTIFVNVVNQNVSSQYTNLC